MGHSEEKFTALGIYIRRLGGYNININDGLGNSERTRRNNFPQKQMGLNNKTQDWNQWNRNKPTNKKAI